MNFLIYAGLKLLTVTVLILVFFGFIKAIDRFVFPKISFGMELEKGNQAVALVVAASILAFVLAMGVILG